MNNIKAAIFDSDGTLVDSRQLVVEGQKIVLIEFGYRQLAVNEIIEAHLGASVAEVFSSLTKLAVDSPVIEKMRLRLDEVQDTLAKTHIHSYEGVVETLAELKDRGLKVALFSSGSIYQQQRNYAAVDIDVEETFDAMVTADDGLKSKPSPDGLLMCLQKLGFKPAEAIYVGDHAVDMLAGREAGVSKVIGVSHGFHQTQELETAGADMIIHKLPELLKVI